MANLFKYPECGVNSKQFNLYYSNTGVSNTVLRVHKNQPPHSNVRPLPVCYNSNNDKNSNRSQNWKWFRCDFFHEYKLPKKCRFSKTKLLEKNKLRLS